MLIDPNNYIHLDEDKWDTKIYRYISFKRLIDIFETGNLTLVKPTEWEDPFENFMLKYFELKKQKSEFDLQFRNCVFAQCWTLSSGSDALWRIYSEDKKGVWIRTTIRKLFEELYIEDRIRNATCFIGKVQYVKKSDIEGMLNKYESLFINTDKHIRIAESLLFKRTAFEHEREIRLIYIDSFPNKNKIISFKSDPLLYIEKIMFDPRIDDTEYKRKKEEIREYGFKGQIFKSTLYKIPISLKK